jgi:hypothetical protein
LATKKTHFFVKMNVHSLKKRSHIQNQVQKFFLLNPRAFKTEDVSLNVCVVWGARATGTNLYWCSDSWHKTKGHICPAQQPFIWIARVREGWAKKCT